MYQTNCDSFVNLIKNFHVTGMNIMRKTALLRIVDSIMSRFN